MVVRMPGPSWIENLLMSKTCPVSNRVTLLLSRSFASGDADQATVHAPTVAIIPSLRTNGKVLDTVQRASSTEAFYLIYAELIDKKMDLWYSSDPEEVWRFAENWSRSAFGVETEPDLGYLVRKM